MHRGQAHAGCFPHVDGAFLRQVHVIEVDEFKLRLLLRPNKHKFDSYTKNFNFNLFIMTQLNL